MPTIKTAQTKIDVDTVFSVSTTATQVLSSDRDRRSMSIQNVGTSKVYVRFGSAPVLGASKYFSYILTAASGAEEGDGGVLSVDNCGSSVYIATASGTSTVIATSFVG
jgi:hypothetical protein